MLAGCLKFNSIPEIGFAHHHYSSRYTFNYGSKNNSFEIVHINAGAIILEFNGETFYAGKGDIFVLFRHLPIKLLTYGHEEQSHCTVQVEFDYDFQLVDTNEPFRDDGIILPFVTQRSTLTKEIKNDLYGIVYQTSTSPNRYSFSAALKTIGVMEKLDSIARNEFMRVKPSHSHLTALVENYVHDNIDKKISLKDISDAIGKSPNYINSIFKKTKGTTIIEYINEEKIGIITTLMRKQNMNFTKACEYVGILDHSYGYRIFKKHTGLTPGMFLKSEQMLR
ncbi:MAG: helix-turn-helix transcriptional regulator [Ruminococcaceae bacterium]|nr:helix-turn-helix transcriptional regulator [Oscillospiraceae bacterium]